jgi:hypothetical protein
MCLLFPTARVLYQLSGTCQAVKTHLQISGVRLLSPERNRGIRIDIFLQKQWHRTGMQQQGYPPIRLMPVIAIAHR